MYRRTTDAAAELTALYGENWARTRCSKCDISDALCASELSEDPIDLRTGTRFRSKSAYSSLVRSGIEPCAAVRAHRIRPSSSIGLRQGA